MTVRLVDPPLNDTEKLLAEVLKVILQPDGRVLFLCESGHGPRIVQRLRVAISRTRNKLAEKNVRSQKFRLRATFHPETHDGKRLQACVLWRQVTDSNLMLQDLEGLMAHG